MIDLEDAIQAFDILHDATCGKADMPALAEHYGVKNAHKIMQARAQIDRLRANTPADGEGHD